MDSHDVKARLDSLVACARMMLKTTGNEVSELLQEESINFLQAGGGETSASLNHIAEETLAYEIRRGHDRRIDVQIDLDPAVSSFPLDAATVGPALANLVCEAIDHSPEGGFIRIGTRLRDDNSILLLIRNHESPIRIETTCFEADGTETNVATRDSTSPPLSIVLSMMATDGGTTSMASPPDGAGVVVSFGWDVASSGSDPAQ